MKSQLLEDREWSLVRSEELCREYLLEVSRSLYGHDAVLPDAVLPEGGEVEGQEVIDLERVLMIAVAGLLGDITRLHTSDERIRRQLERSIAFSFASRILNADGDIWSVVDKA